LCDKLFATFFSSLS